MEPITSFLRIRMDSSYAKVTLIVAPNQFGDWIILIFLKTNIALPSKQHKSY